MINYQTNAVQSEKDKWILKGARQWSNRLYIGPNRLPLLTFWLLLMSHPMGHMHRWGTIKELKGNSFCPGYPQNFWTNYFSVHHINLTKFLEEINTPHEVLQGPHCPLQPSKWIYDLLPAWVCSHCLVIVCMFSGWTKCSLTRYADTTTIV